MFIRFRVSLNVFQRVAMGKDGPIDRPWLYNEVHRLSTANPQKSELSAPGNSADDTLRLPQDAYSIPA
jgi:hypothetical protein